MLPPLASVDDLATWMGPKFPIPSGPSTARAAAILAASSTLVRRFTGSTWVDEEGELAHGDDPVLWDAVAQVTIMVAERVWKNPDGETQAGTGPFSHTVEAWAALGCALRDDEKDLLGGTPGVPGLGVISTTRGPIETGSVLHCRADASDPWFGDV